MYSRKKPIEDLPQENTAIWSCTKAGCSGWMRDNFAFEHEPTCWQCNSPMIRSMKVLPVLVNSNTDIKVIKKGTSII